MALEGRPPGRPCGRAGARPSTRPRESREPRQDKFEPIPVSDQKIKKSDNVLKKHLLKKTRSLVSGYEENELYRTTVLSCRDRSLVALAGNGWNRLEGHEGDRGD